jgi:hypothetical protein
MTKTFSPSEAALSVFELAKRQPQFVLRFCIIYALGVMLTYALAGGTGVGQAMQGYMALAASGKPPNPERILEVLSPAGPGFAIIMIVGLLTGALTSAMGLRKAIRDEDQGLFGLQFGKDEVNVILAMLLVGVILFGINFGVSMIGGIVGGANPAFVFLALMVSLVAMGIVGVRLSQFGVLTIAQGKVAVIPSWAETKGQAWRFLGAYLLWLVVASVIAILAQSIGTLGASALGVKVGVGMPASLAEFSKPGWLLFTLVYGLASGLGNLGMICVGAYAWHQMRGDLPVSAQTR